MTISKRERLRRQALARFGLSKEPQEIVQQSLPRETRETRRIVSLEIDVTDGQTVVIPKHVAPDTSRMRLQNRAGTPCPIREAKATFPDKHIRWREHGDYGISVQVRCGPCGRTWK